MNQPNQAPLKSPALIVVSAPSGAGKTTLCQRLLSDFPDQLTLSISTTTRLPRGSEQDGVEYYFVDDATFDRKIKRGEFAEWATVHGNRYGTSKKSIEQTFKRGSSILLDIDVQGAESLRAAFPHQSLLVFVAPPSLDELEFRLRARGTDTEASIQMRMNNARKEMQKLSQFDLVIVNDHLERAYAELRKRVQFILESGAPPNHG